MALKINQNIFSQLVQRHLTRNAKDLETAYERLSSGQQINRSSDNPTGMAVSESLRYEIQGIRQNQQNVTSAFSMIGTAESQMGSLVDNLQRARELVVQAANDINDSSNRQVIQTELDQIIDEIQRITSSSKYNELMLFDGSLANKRIQVGTSSSETVLLNVGDLRPHSLGSLAFVESASPVGTAPVNSNTLFINGIAIPVTQNDGISTVNATASAVAKATAINAVKSQTGVEAQALPSVATASAGGVGSILLDGVTNQLTINGVNVGNVQVLAGDSNGALVNAINSIATQTGVRAALNSSGHLELTAEDGRNIRVQANGASAAALGFSAAPVALDSVSTGEIRLISTQTFTVDGNPALIGIAGAAPVVVPTDPGTALNFLSVADHDSASLALRSLDAAIAQVGDERARLGAVYNRLEALNSSLAQRQEDLQSSDSKIRDADYALESARLTQAQILQDAALSVLAQANVSPQRAFELLRR